MSEYELIQERFISGKGLLKVPTDTRKNRAYILYAAVFRKPSNPYLNFNYNPPRGRYGTLVFLRDSYVIKNTALEYPNQVFDGVNDISGQTLLAVKCAYDGILQTFYNMSIALAATPGGQGLTPISITNLITDYTNLRLSWDECRLQCYADTAIRLSLYRLVYDVCDDDYNADIPAPIPDLPTQISPGEPIEGISPAYDDESDDGNTVPYPGDEPPTLEPCITVIRGAGLNANTCGALNNQGDYPYNGYAELVPVTVPPNNCAGLRVFLDGVDLGVGQTFHTSAVILSRTGDCVPPPEG